MNINRFKTSLTLSASGGVVGLLLLGCASDPAGDAAFDPAFGSSVRHMIAVQTSNPDVGSHGLDGRKSQVALTAYRDDVASFEALRELELKTPTVSGN
ncbi:hypothetical protein F2Q65_11400 [Thiohalocapsa marina]|uniref:Uncharacterized protein n=1 Tax=Thiohalocapsa marina TaxID=424902 RepID=A0A5M8FJ13_9GAMM|nr:hypothetical protein [Thiohalocapsa marina]KAA6184699.1 hypothetical protein F2Q65_11400 [Thiohalocapsa marina]